MSDKWGGVKGTIFLSESTKYHEKKTPKYFSVYLSTVGYLSKLLLVTFHHCLRADCGGLCGAHGPDCTFTLIIRVLPSFLINSNMAILRKIVEYL